MLDGNLIHIAIIAWPQHQQKHHHWVDCFDSILFTDLLVILYKEKWKQRNHNTILCDTMQLCVYVNM